LQKHDTPLSTQNQPPIALDAAALAALESCVSLDRLAPYRLSPSDPAEDVIARYLWNVALCEALYPAIHHAEVSLRNTLYRTVSMWHSRIEWVSGGPAAFLRPQEVRSITETLASRVRTGQPVNPPDMVAALHLGFWTGLLDVRYERTHTLWPHLLKTAFPGMPRRLRVRANVAGRFDAVRRLRNRVFHHEPVWSVPDLPQKHAWVLEALSWVSPEMRDLASGMDRFDQVYRAGPQGVLSRLGSMVP
jgi:hypothetical protein